MAYTPEQLKEMSDHEINLAVAKKLNFKYYMEEPNPHFPWVSYVPESCIDEDDSFTFAEYESMEQICEFDPCNSWNDVMPIAEKYAISVKFPSFYREIPEVRKYIHKKDCYLSCNNQNPKRAICEVFLQMDIGE